MILKDRVGINCSSWQQILSLTNPILLKQISSDTQLMSCGCAAVSTENFKNCTSKITTKLIQYPSLEI